MNRENIIGIAEHCGIKEFENNESQAENILLFASMIAARERDACKKICSEVVERTFLKSDQNGWIAAVACEIAISARGKE